MAQAWRFGEYRPKAAMMSFFQSFSLFSSLRSNVRITGGVAAGMSKASQRSIMGTER